MATASQPTVSVSSARSGDTITVYTNRTSTSVVHSLAFQVGNHTQTIVSDITDSYDWVIPDIAPMIQNKTEAEMTIICSSKEGGRVIGRKSVVISVKVPTASAFSVDADTKDIGSDLTVTISKASPVYRHRIELVFAGKVHQMANGIDNSTSFNLPYDLAKDIVGETERVAKVVCSSYNGTALVGSVVRDITLVVPNNEITRPQFDEEGFVLTPYGSLPTSLSGVFVSGKAGISATFTATSEYDVITSYKLHANGATYSGNPALSSNVWKSGNVKVSGTVTDSRGFSRSVEKTIYVAPYSAPKILPKSGSTHIVCCRCAEDGTPSQTGNNLLIECSLSYSKVVVNGIQRNFCSLSYRIGSGAEIPLIAQGATIAEVSKIIPNAFTAEQETSVTISASDYFGYSIHYESKIPTVSVPVHFSIDNKHIGIGRYADDTLPDGSVSVGWDLYFDEGKTIHGLFNDYVTETGIAVISNGQVFYRKYKSGYIECAVDKYIGNVSFTPIGSIYQSTTTLLFSVLWLFQTVYWAGATVKADAWVGGLDVSRGDTTINGSRVSLRLYSATSTTISPTISIRITAKLM